MVDFDWKEKGTERREGPEGGAGSGSDMCRDRPSPGPGPGLPPLPLLLLLRLGVLLAAVCVCVHVYLETGWQGAPSRHSQKFGEQSEELDGSVKRDGGGGGAAGGGEGGAGGGAAAGAGGEPPGPRPHRKTKTPRWHIELQPWASDSRSLQDEAERFLRYITTPQVSCASSRGVEAVRRGAAGDWAVCLDPRYSLVHRLHSRRCRMYSFGLGVDDRSLERSLATSGCEVHCFDPSLKQPHLQRADMWLHRLSVDWRDPNPAVVAQRQYATTKKLATILNNFGHREVDVLKADMEGAEWKILENLVLEGVLQSAGQLLLELHLHWAGFEVSGDDPSVVRYWFSLLTELQRANFHLFHVYSDPEKPHVFLHKNILNASSTYTLGWVNTRWKPARN